MVFELCLHYFDDVGIYFIGIVNQLIKIYCHMC